MFGKTMHFRFISKSYLPSKMAAPIDSDKVFVREIETDNKKTLRINQYSVGDVGCVVWDAALVLSKYLETRDFNFGELLKNKTVLEIGAGTGVVGLVAAAHGSKVVITDLEEFVPLMQMNIDTNKEQFTSTVEAKSLKWGEDIDDDFNKSCIDIILIADCIYYEESLEPLVNTMVSLCGESTCIYCCYEERTTGNKPELQRKFFKLVEAQFKMEKIGLERQNQEFRSEDIHIYKFTRLKK